MADICFNIACKELKIGQIVQLNQLFQLLRLVHIYGHGFYELSRMLMRKNVNNDVSKDSLIGCRTHCGHQRRCALDFRVSSSDLFLQFFILILILFFCCYIGLRFFFFSFYMCIYLPLFLFAPNTRTISMIFIARGLISLTHSRVNKVIIIVGDQFKKLEVVLVLKYTQR